MVKCPLHGKRENININFKNSLNYEEEINNDETISDFKSLKCSNKVAAAYNSANIIYNPYQYLPWLYMFNENNNSILITDEVGLGKTIEAGIIIKEEYKENSEAEVLIICPAFLRNKWKYELKEKFYINSSIYGENSDSFKTTILPLSRLKKFNEENIKQFDLVIVDEVHYFKNNKSSRYKYLDYFLKNNKTQRKVFMTATPINNKDSDYKSIKNLLGNNFIKTSTTKKQAYINIPKRNINEIYIDLNPLEKELYNVTNNLDPFSGTIYRHIGASCLYALIKYSKKYATNESEVKAELKEALEELLESDYNEFTEIQNISEQISRFNLNGEDSKITTLIKLISEIEDKKIIIFSHYIETIKYLHSELSTYFNCEYIYGNIFSNHSIVVDKKNKFSNAKAWFDQQDLNDKTILICSDSCREGIDLDSASCLINYDLPFNPSILEQRIGRIDRMCQKNNMNIFNFHVNDTYDDRLHMILSSKLLIINYYSEYGVGNHLSIMEDGMSPFDKFISYFKKNSNFSMTNDDFTVIKKILRKIGVSTSREIKQSELLSLLVENKKNIISLFNEKEIDELTDEQLIVQKKILDEKLNFPSKTFGTIELDASTKTNLIELFSNNLSLRSKLSCIIIDYDQKLKYVEDTGCPMNIDEEDIKSSIYFDTDINTDVSFISRDLVEMLVSQGAKVYEH